MKTRIWGSSSSASRGEKPKKEASNSSAPSMVAADRT
jgi:hypothetical protein